MSNLRPVLDYGTKKLTGPATDKSGLAWKDAGLAPWIGNAIEADRESLIKRLWPEGEPSVSLWKLVQNKQGKLFAKVAKATDCPHFTPDGEPVEMAFVYFEGLERYVERRTVELCRELGPDATKLWSPALARAVEKWIAATAPLATSTMSFHVRTSSIDWFQNR